MLTFELFTNVQLSDIHIHNIFTMLCNRYQHLYPKLFHHPQQKLYPLKQTNKNPPPLVLLPDSGNFIIILSVSEFAYCR